LFRDPEQRCVQWVRKVGRHMEKAGSERDRSIEFRQHTRIKIPVPFVCSISRKDALRWFAKNSKDATGFGVVYDVSMKGARVSSEAPIKPGDQVMVTLQLPEHTAPLAVERATVRWEKNQTFGLEFINLTFTGALQLKRFIAAHSLSAS